MENNYRGTNLMLVDPTGRDFRPQAGSPLVDAAKPIAGITDGYKGRAPDIGAYESGGKRWLPGCYNALWISAPQKHADGTFTIRVALRMPPTEPVFLAVTSAKSKVNLNRLTFTPINWMNVQNVTLSGNKNVQFFDKHLGSAETSDTGAIDTQAGRIVPFEKSDVTYRAGKASLSQTRAATVKER